MDLGLLHLAATSAGLPLDWLGRASLVEQPRLSTEITEVSQRFSNRFLGMANIGTQSRELANIVNSAGQAWLLLAFPGGTAEDARKIFTFTEAPADTGNEQPGVDWQIRIALAGPAYSGAAVLALCLLGCPQVPSVGAGAQSDVVFRREAATDVDLREWSFGYFKTRDQLLPTFLLILDEDTALSSSGAAASIRIRNSYLESREKVRGGLLDRVRKHAAEERLRLKRAARYSQSRRTKQNTDTLRGHTRVAVAEIAQPKSTVMKMDLVPEEAEAEQMGAKGGGTRGEIGLESFWIKVPGPKQKREPEHHDPPGGLEWNNRIMLNAVLTRVLGKASQKEAGVAGLHFLGRNALEVYAKAQPLGKYKSRKLSGGTPLPAFKGISPESLRMGVFALEVAKSDAFIGIVENASSLYIGYDSTTVGTMSVQALYVKAFHTVVRGLDGAGTRMLGADVFSKSLDLHALAHKRLTEYEVTDDDGRKRVTSIEAADHFGAQMQQGGIYLAAMRNRSLTVVSDGGHEGSGKGNQALVRLNMAGENSVGHRAFLLWRAGGDGMKLLNDRRLWVPLMEFFGFDPLNGEIGERRPAGQRLNTVRQRLKAATRAYREKAGKGTVDGAALPLCAPDSDGEDVILIISSEDDEPSSRDDGTSTGPHPRSKPIYDPLCGQSTDTAAVQPMPIFDFFVWDICLAYPFLRLADRIEGMTEEMVASAERFLGILLQEACTEVDHGKFKSVSLRGFQSLQIDKCVHDEAINLVLEEMTHVLGGRFVSKWGMYTTGPESPLILRNQSIPAESDNATKAIYVLDSIRAARLVLPFEATEKCALTKGQERGRKRALKALADMVRVFRSKKRPSDEESKAIVFEPGSEVFAFTHRRLHYVSTEVANLGALTEAEDGGGGSSRNAVTITIADSNSRTPKFEGHMHEALHIALRAAGAIGETQDVDHVGLPLPPQGPPDCAFYILTRLACKLTGKSPPPHLWPVITRMGRVWTGLQAYRRLLEEGAILDVVETCKRKFLSSLPVLDAQTVAVPPGPMRQQRSTVRALGDLWTRAIEGLPDFLYSRRAHRGKKVRQKLVNRILDELAVEAAAAFKPEAREMPEQLPTDTPVMACSAAPARTRASGSEDSEGKWKRRYSDVVQRGMDCKISMQKNPARYFLMAERDKRVEKGGTEPAAQREEPAAAQGGTAQREEPAAAQGGTSGTGQGGTSGTSGGKSSGKWRQLANALLLWCIRHRAALAAQQAFKRTDRLQHRAERAINHANNPFFWPHARGHMHAFLDLPLPAGRDSVRPGPVHAAVQGAMRAQVESYGPTTGEKAIKSKIKLQSCFDTLRKETSKTLQLQKPKKCAKTRWGTRGASLRWLALYNRLLASALIQVHGEGTEKGLADNAKGVFNETGFVDGHTMRLPPKPGKQLHFLTNGTDIAFCAIGAFVDQVMIGPMMEAMSHHMECSRCSVCGIDSIFRRLLHFLEDDLFVGKFNIGDSFTGSVAASRLAAKRGMSASKGYINCNKFKLFTESRKKHKQFVIVKLAHRGVASLRGAHKRAFLINPNANVRGAFGRFCTDSMVGCVHALLAGLRRASLVGVDRLGPWMPLTLYPTLEQQWHAEVVPYLVGNVGRDVARVPVDQGELKAWEETQRQRFCRNMMKAQWALTQVVNDVRAAILQWFDNELFCPLGFIACSFRTRTVKARKEENGAIVSVLVANKFAVANLVVGSRVLDELKSHYPGKNLPDFVPTQLADLLTNGQAMGQADEFCLAKDIEGFVLVDKDGKDILDGKGNRVPVGPAPVERFEDLANQVHPIVCTVLSNNDPERVFTHAARAYSAGARNMSVMTLTSYVGGKDWINAGLWGKEKDELFVKQFGKCREFIAQYYPRLQLLTMPDASKCEEARTAAQLAKLPKKYRNGALFPESNIKADKDFFTFGQEAPGHEDGDQVPALACRGGASPGIRLRQRARAIRARKGPKQPIQRKHALKKKGAPPAKRRKLGSGRSEGPASPRGSVSESRMHDGPLVHDTESRTENRMAVDQGPSANSEGQEGVSADNDGQGVEPEPTEGQHTALPDTPSLGGPDASPSSASALTGSNPGEDGGRAMVAPGNMVGGLGAPSAIAGTEHARARKAKPKSAAEHKSFVDAREWLRSPAVKEAKKRDTKQAKRERMGPASVAASAAGAAGGSLLSSDANASGEAASDSDSDGDAVWTPATVTFNCRDYVTVQRKVDAKTIRVNKGRKSSCILHHIYDDVSGESQLVQIQSLQYVRKEKGWIMEFCRVYSTEHGIRAAEQEEDKSVAVGDKILVQIGRESLRKILDTGKLIHHIGDVRHFWKVEYVLGICAWLPASTLLCEAAKQTASKKDLQKALIEIGVAKPEAQLMADDPIYIGDYFSEAAARAGSSDGGDSSDTSSESDSDSARIRMPSRKPLRELMLERQGKALFDVDVEDSTSKAGTGAQDAVAGVGPEQSDLADTDSGLDAPLVTKRVSGDQKGKARIGEAGSAKGRQGTGRGRESESPESGSDLDKANKGGSGDQIGKRKDSTGEAGPAKRRQGPGRGRGRGGVGSGDVSGDGQGPGLKRGCEENVQLSSRTEAKKKAAGRGGAAKCDGESVDAGKGAARQGPVGQGRRQVRSDADRTELRGPPRVGSRHGRG